MSGACVNQQAVMASSHNVPHEEMARNLEAFWEHQRRDVTCHTLTPMLQSCYVLCYAVLLTHSSCFHVWLQIQIDRLDDKGHFKPHNDLPLARIKRIMKSDEDVRSCALV